MAAVDSYLQMPFSLEAEQSVLGSVLIDPECISEIASILRPEDFHVSVNREIYEIMLTLFQQSEAIDLVTVLDKMEASEVMEEKEGKAYLFQLTQLVPSTANVLKYADIVKQKSYLRQLIDASKEITESCFEGAEDVPAVIDAAEQRIYDISHSRAVGGLIPLKEILLETYDRIHAIAQGNGEEFKGLETDYYDLDAIITGLNRSDLIFLAARPGMGKTSFALNIARNVALKYKKTVAFFSLEMSRSQLVERMLSSEALIDSTKLRTAELSEEEWTKLARAAVILSEAPIKFDDTSGITVTEMKAKLRREKNLGLVVIDYLQLMQSGRRVENRVQEISQITRSLKIMAKELDVPVITLSQLSRAVESRTEKRPMLSDLRESGSIEQDADMVLFLYRDDYYDRETEEKNQAQVIVAKNRHGSTGEADLIFLGQYTRYFNKEKVHYDSGS